MSSNNKFIQAQESDWELNPKILNDTMDVHLYPKDHRIYVASNRDIICDNEGYIWVSTQSEGLLRIDINNPISFKQNKPEGYNFDQLSARNIYEFEDSLYFGTERGFVTYNPEKETFHRYGKNDLEKLPAYESGSYCLAYIAEDSILIGNKYGITLFNKREDKITKHLWEVDPPKDGNSTHNFVHQIKVDPYNPNTIWAVGRKGLFKLDKRTWEREYLQYVDDIKNNLAVNYMDDFVITEEGIYVIYYGNQIFWWETGNQILRFDKKLKEWKLIISHEHIDKEGIKHYPQIQTIQKFGKYALTTSRSFGIQLIDTETDSIIQTYFRHPSFKLMDEWKDPNRLLDSYLNEVWTATIDQNGYLWGAYRRDFIVRSKEPVFLKEKLEYKPIINLNTLYVNGIKQKKQNFSNPNELNSFKLNQREREITFEVGIINPIYESIAYEYKYNSNNWKSTLNNRTVHINSLDAGNNKIKIRALLNNKVIGEESFTFYSTPRLHEKWWFIFGILALIGFTFYQFYQLNIRKIKDEEKIKTSFNKKIAEMEMEVLKAQMNPHFLFNSLNSIKHYSINKDKHETSQYITTFSQLLRQILQNSNSKIVSLAQELRAIELYVEIEKKRFENIFDFKIQLENHINEDTIFIPPMILQPFVENAIWHGLLPKKNNGELTIEIRVNDDVVICEITDNGIGRKAAFEISKLKSEYKKDSLGTKITSNRLKLAEEIYGIKTDLKIIDLQDINGIALGTKIIVHLPRIISKPQKSNMNKYD